jgi:hypothetical protein
MLNILSIVSTVTGNVAAYCRVTESIDFMHELRTGISSGDLKSRNDLYIHHIIKHAWCGLNGGNMNFWINLLCQGKLVVSGLLGQKIV